MKYEEIADIEYLQAAFSRAGYVCRLGALGAFPHILLAENPYGLVACVEHESWQGVEAMVSDLQAELTHFAINGDRPQIRWDLYLLIHLRITELQAVDNAILERIESDTKFCRKFVRVNLARDQASLDRALRPFMPLRSGPPLKVSDPLSLIKTELTLQGLDSLLIESAIQSFRQTGQVVVP